MVTGLRTPGIASPLQKPYGYLPCSQSLLLRFSHILLDFFPWRPGATIPCTAFVVACLFLSTNSLPPIVFSICSSIPVHRVCYPLNYNFELVLKLPVEPVRKTEEGSATERYPSAEVAKGLSSGNLLCLYTSPTKHNQNKLEFSVCLLAF